MELLRIAKDNILHKSVKADFPAFISIPATFIVLALVLVVLIKAWNLSTPLLNTTAKQIGLPLNGTAIAGVKGLNESAYLQIGNQLYNFDFYLPLIFYFAMLSIAIATLLKSPNPIAWMLGILFAPFIYWITSYESNIAYAIFTQHILQTQVGAIPTIVGIMAQLNNITIFFYILYILGMAIRVYFYQPPIGTSNQQQQMAELLQRRMGR
jgi:hypothetical protein